MTGTELALMATDAVNNPVSNDLIIKMPGKWGKNDHRYLAGRKSPRGRIVSSFVGGIIVRFDAIDVLAWCVAKGFLELTGGDDNDGR